MTGAQATALFLLLLALLVTLLFGAWAGLAGAFAGLRDVARGAVLPFGAALLMLALGTWAGLRQAMLAGLGGAAAGVAALALLPDARGAGAVPLIEAGWLLALAALAWREAAPRWVLLALVPAVAMTGLGAYAAGRLPDGAPPGLGGIAAGFLVMLAGGVMLEMLARLLSGIARPARIVAALAGTAALTRLVGEW